MDEPNYERLMEALLTSPYGTVCPACGGTFEHPLRNIRTDDHHPTLSEPEARRYVGVEKLCPSLCHTDRFIEDFDDRIVASLRGAVVADTGGQAGVIGSETSWPELLTQAEIDSKMDDWLQYGIDMDWITPAVCGMHDTPEFDPERIEELEEGGDPCYTIVRIKDENIGAPAASGGNNGAIRSHLSSAAAGAPWTDNDLRDDPRPDPAEAAAFWLRAALPAPIIEAVEGTGDWTDFDWDQIIFEHLRHLLRSTKPRVTPESTDPRHITIRRAFYNWLQEEDPGMDEDNDRVAAEYASIAMKGLRHLEDRAAGATPDDDYDDCVR